MGTPGQGPPTQQQYAHAPYPPQQQQYYAQQQPTPPGQPSRHSQPPYQQYQQQYHQHYQPPQQPQYYYPPQQQQYASPPAAAASQPPPPVASPSHQQHFFAELEAPQSTTPAAKPRPTSTSTSSPSTTAVPTPAAQTQHGIPGPVVFEMPAEAPAPKPDDASKPQRIASAAATSPPAAAAAAANAGAAAQANQKLPPIQANPWGFFLPDDLPERVDSTSPAKESLADDQMLSVKPLRIVKTGPAEEKPGSGPQSGVLGDVAGVVPCRPPPTSAPASPVSTAPSASRLPYPVDGASIPTPDSHPMPQPGAQITLPIHPAAVSSSPNLASPTLFAPSPLTPLQTGTTAPQPQSQHYHALLQQAYTQATPVSPIIVQAGLPPTLPVGSYFPNSHPTPVRKRLNHPPRRITARRPRLAPIPQPSYANGPQHYQPVPPPLPPRTSPPTPGQYGYATPSPYGPPPTRPNYQAPPPKPDSRLFSSATARKLLNKTTELVDQTITPYLQDHRYRPPHNGYQYQYQYQYPNRPPSGPQGQYYQQGYAPSQRT
ncbi:hypothetical protein Ct61P_14253 [Colletotrichum tofieldiae]|nr:hypothetical protein Ct61P_14253 [Colletotrichum tofieldiae]